MKKHSTSVTYRITYTTDPKDLDSDFKLMYTEAMSYSDAMRIVHNIERFFGGVTVACEPVEVHSRGYHRSKRRDQRAKDVRYRGYSR